MSKYFLIGALLALSVTASLSHADVASTTQKSGEVAYGILEGFDVGHNMVFINDEAMFYGPDLRIRDESDSYSSDVSRIEPGTPVKFIYELQGREMYVFKIQSIDEIPFLEDEDDVSMR